MEDLIMYPATGQHGLRFVGDRLTFTLSRADGRPLPAGWGGYLRTTLGRARVLRQEIIQAHTGRLALQNAAWHDIPMRLENGQWKLDLALTETGYFRAKAYARDERGWQHWPKGPDAGISIHPDSYRTANTIYCAFVRMFGSSRTALSTKNDRLDNFFAPLDKEGYTIVPPSGKLRDLIKELPHIFDTLGCRILHLLPVTPVPTTYAKFGRFGSPYAVQDLTAIDPALVEFDKRTTGIEQFRELTYAVHLKGGRVFLDVVPNHTGWGSTLQEQHPEWFVKNERGEFVSPGAWGVTWEDLVEMDHRNPKLWEELGDVFLTWCRRGVDGFRCDAGYKIPLRAWQYITARVLDEFPETIFLLEGLGGSWEATENLLSEGGMQWAYSELFQNYSGSDVARYLDYSLGQSEHRGVYVHYSETHDNDRLAKRGRNWSLLRNQLCALTSVSGGFGFTCGVEWLAPEKVNVHSSRGLAWGSEDNLVKELAHLNKLLADHPCFLDGATLVRQSAIDSPVYALSRVSAEGLDRVLVLVNTDMERPQRLAINNVVYKELGEPAYDLVTNQAVKSKALKAGQVEFTLPPGACLCLSHLSQPQGLSGEAYRQARAKAAWATTALSSIMPAEEIGPHDWRWLAQQVEPDPGDFLAWLAYLKPELVRVNLREAVEAAMAERKFPKVIRWNLLDTRRITLVPPEHWLYIEDEAPFRASLCTTERTLHVHSIRAGKGYVACFAPGQPAADTKLLLERYVEKEPRRVESTIRFLNPGPQVGELELKRGAVAGEEPLIARHLGLALLTNGLGGMARMQVDLGEVKSKYDCVLGANLHPSVPVDRHIFVKRIRVWVVADGFITPLNRESLVSFTPGPPARWQFVASTSDGRAVEIHLIADMLPDRNTTVLRFVRPLQAPAFGRDLPPESKVSLTVRVDLVDRSFHWERRRDAGAEYYFSINSRPLEGQIGFEFAPPDRSLRVTSDAGQYHPQEEWSTGVSHPVEASRGLQAQEDAFSPGWFDLPMPRNSNVLLTLSADPEPPAAADLKEFEKTRQALNERAVTRARLAAQDTFGKRLAMAVQAFVVRRGNGKTIIAGYPWFLDWGRDSLICARGLLAAGLVEEVKQLLITFGHFEANGTLPNSIFGEDTSNRDTSDAPLWYGLACEETARLLGATGQASFYTTAVDTHRTIADVLKALATGYMRGTPNGIRMDPASGLIWSPSHFTWMDTNYPAGTPREGYPVEIQALWIRLLRQLATLNIPSVGESWAQLALRAEDSLRKLFWLPERGYLADVLLVGSRHPAAEAVADTALRSNYLFAVSLGLVTGEQAQRAVQAAVRHLVVPGALRTLAPLPVSPPLPIYGNQRQLLNDPQNPYWGRYEGDEDTRRKPAYHNGTAWTWTFPVFCEALARAWNFAPEAVAAARACLGSMDRTLVQSCVGHIPEIVDGDAPHWQRGCDAQAWGATEALRVWKLLNEQGQ